jgi:hypothetical protein
MKKHRHLQRLLSLLIAIAVAFTLIPSIAFAMGDNNAPAANFDTQLNEIRESFFDNTTKIKIYWWLNTLSFRHIFWKIRLNRLKNRFIITVIARYTACVFHLSNTRIVILNPARDVEVCLLVCVCVCVCNFEEESFPQQGNSTRYLQN